MVGTAGAIIITIVVLAVVGGVGWVFYSRLQAKKLGVRRRIRSSTFLPCLPYLPSRSVCYAMQWRKADRDFLHSFLLHPSPPSYLLFTNPTRRPTGPRLRRQEASPVGSMTRSENLKIATTAVPPAHTKAPAQPRGAAASDPSTQMRHGTRASVTRRTTTGRVAITRSRSWVYTRPAGRRTMTRTLPTGAPANPRATR